MEREFERRSQVVACVAAAFMFAAPLAGAQTIYWTSFTSATAGAPGSAIGTITAPGGTVGVSYSGEVQAGSQTNNAGYNFFRPVGTFNGGTGTAPSNGDFIQLHGGNTLTNTITFSTPVNNLFFAVLSLGAGGNPVQYVFNTPFSIASQGPSDVFHGCATCLSQSGNVLTGTEGDGTLLFSGPINSLSFTISGDEIYHGFTVGVNDVAGQSTVPEPSSMALLGTGLFGLVPMGLRKLRK